MTFLSGFGRKQISRMTKILFGVQATGNGHISRAKLLVKALEAQGAQVDVLLSGRGKYFGEAIPEFGRYDYREGLTLHSESGKVSLAKSVYKNNFHHYRRDIKNFDTSGYDLILTDFEPISAHAGMRNKKTVISISNQNSLLFPEIAGNLQPIDRAFIKKFTPATQYIANFYCDFGLPILPPITALQSDLTEEKNDKILVYLPFEHPKEIEALLARLPRVFEIFHPSVKTPRKQENCYWKPISVKAFEIEFKSTQKIICNAGFGLTSEALACGKDLLVKPVKKQPEQIANGRGLSKAGLAMVADSLNEKLVSDFIQAETDSATKIRYPNVATEIAKEICRHGSVDSLKLSKNLWESA